jgi:FlaA1/EpsC-like NDP-sugar epimerase
VYFNEYRGFESHSLRHHSRPRSAVTPPPTSRSASAAFSGQPSRASIRILSSGGVLLRPVYTSPVIASLKGIDWGDFLQRPALVSPPPEALHIISTMPMMITGAGGSIGSALAARLASLAPPALLLLESAEKNLFELQRTSIFYFEAARSAPATFVLGSAGDRALLEELFVAHAPRVVFHAAALKHVPLLEQQPLAAIVNNIFATETVATAASLCGARVVLLSTDKAVEPASVMGATKRVAEEIVLASGGVVLRLGNVLASSGSVTEVFAHQIARGEPLTITDSAARRYFLSLDEAVNLLLFASVYSGSSAVLAPALLTDYAVTKLARFMAHQLAPGRAISLRFTGLRPGDKLTERLWSGSDTVHPVNIGNLVSIQSNRLTQARLESGLAALHAAVEERDLGGALNQLRSLVPDFRPSQAVLALARHFDPRVCA